MYKIHIAIYSTKCINEYYYLCAGETASKTNDVIDSARGGTLLIDEAYQLMPVDSPRDVGIEAIETIMGTIEGYANITSDMPAYIFAGYSK